MPFPILPSPPPLPFWMLKINCFLHAWSWASLKIKAEMRMQRQRNKLWVAPRLGDRKTDKRKLVFSVHTHTHTERVKAVAWWEHACLACTKPWVWPQYRQYTHTYILTYRQKDRKDNDKETECRNGKKIERSIGIHYMARLVRTDLDLKLSPRMTHNKPKHKSEVYLWEFAELKGVNIGLSSIKFDWWFQLELGRVDKIRTGPRSWPPVV